MTAAEMQAIAPAPEGCEWTATETSVSWHAWLYSGPRVVVHIGRHDARMTSPQVELVAYGPHPTPLDALLALRRLAGHLWPWPGWPVVQGVRPAGWGPRPTADEREAHRATGGSWLWRRNNNPVWQVVDPDTVGTGQFCAIDRDGRWVDVDTRGPGPGGDHRRRAPARRVAAPRPRGRPRRRRRPAAGAVPRTAGDGLMARCSTCGARMVWAVTEAGKPIPLDPEPTANGNLVVADADAPELLARTYLPLLDGDDVPRYTSHFATCPDASLHRKRGR